MNTTTEGGLPARDAAFGHGLRGYWTLDPAVHFLNHGSYGATPRHVLAAQANWRQRMESEPVRFMSDELPGAWLGNRDRLADFVGAPRAQTVLVDNATEGVAAVLRSLRWKAGDRVVIANHAYPAVRNLLRFLAEREGIVPVEASVPWPLPDEGALVDAYLAALRGGARLAILDHVFSPLAVVTPLEPILARCAGGGIAVLVDGAHAPGQLPLEVAGLFARGVTWYAGNAHKWLNAPKGAAFLAVREGAERGLHPPVISNFYGDGWAAEFGWTGTRDPTAKLAVAAALDFLGALDPLRYRTHLAQQAAELAARLSDAWGVRPGAPPRLSAAMVTLPLPDAEPATREAVQRWRRRFLDEARTEVPVFAIDNRLWVRLSAQVYNTVADVEPLARFFDTPRRH